MRHPLAGLAPAAFVSGCSLIYNPANIDKPPPDGHVFADVGIDVEIRADANPAALELTEAHPTTIYEGTGTGGSRPAVVVLRGEQFASDPSGNLAVTLVPDTPDVVTLESFEVSGNGDYIALAIIAPVSDTCDGGTNVNIDITVSQSDGLGGTVMQTLDDAVVLACLNELDALEAPLAGALDPLYSRIDIDGPVMFAGKAGASLLLRSASYIKIAGGVDVSAQGQAPGPGGGRGGDAQKAGEGPKPGGGTNQLGAGGGGAGFVIAGTAGGKGTLNGAGGSAGGTTGDPWLASYATNASSGGGGALGVIGGGGGGTVELTAHGDIEVTGDVIATGASGSSVGGAVPVGGGAGSGGVILVRAGNLLTLANVSVAAGSKVSNGGASSDGRVRIDAAKGDYPAGGTECTLPFQATCTKTRGPMFVDAPTRTAIQTPAIMLRGTPNDASSTLRVFDKNGDPVAGMTYTPVFGTTGNATLTPVLKAGYNNVCVWVEGGAPGDALAQSRNCVEIGYLPP